MMDRWKQWARVVKRDVVTIWLIGRDPRVPWYVKALALAGAAYALSPIDLIPDFIPVLGYLDDLIVLPLFILLIVRLVPAELLAELRREAERLMDTGLPRNAWGVAFIITCWLALAGLFGSLIWRWARLEG